MIPEVNMTALGAHLAYVRRQQHLRQADLAREVGIHEVTLSRIENGKLPGVTVAVLARLAMRLDISLDQLLQWQPGQRLRQGDFRKRLYSVRVRVPSGSSRSMKPCSLWEGKSWACTLLPLKTISHSVHRKSPIYAWQHPK